MKSLSIVVPIYNEESRIDRLLKELEKGFQCKRVALKKIIFVDDGSTDAISQKLKEAKFKRNLNISYQLIRYKKNQGRGHAVKVGTQFTKTDYVLYVDADFSIPLTNLKRFVPYMEDNFDVILGSKKMPGSTAIIPRSLIRNIVGYGHSLIASLVLGTYYWDFQGGFKIFSKRYIREVFSMLKIDRWGFDMEVLFLARKMNFKVKELPVVWSHVDKDSKVELIHDITRSIKDMLKIQYNWLLTDKYHLHRYKSANSKLVFRYL